MVKYTKVDLGCGSGIIVESLKKQGYNPSYCDIKDRYDGNEFKKLMRGFK